MLSKTTTLGIPCLFLGLFGLQQSDPFQRHLKAFKVACNDDATLRPADEELWKRAQSVELSMHEAIDIAVKYAKEDQHYEDVRVLSAELALIGKPFYSVEILTRKDGIARRWELHVGLTSKKVKFWLIQNRLPGTPIPEGKELQSLPSGVVWVDIREGDGAIVDANSTVVIHYVTTLLNGNLVFDTYNHAFPEEFAIQNPPIPGLGQGLVGARVGTKRKLILPYSSAFGAEGLPGRIPRNATVIYDVEIKNVRKGEVQGPAPAPGG